MTPEQVRAAWLTTWGALRRWHRYEVHGFEHLTRGPALIVGYHGRPIAWDLCMLTSVMHERLGYLPHGVAHAAFAKGKGTAVLDGLGFVTGEGPALDAAIARGEHILVQPGGTREGCRSIRHRYEVDWGERTGYLRLALRHGIPIIPAAGIGVDDAFIGFNNGYRWGRRLGVPAGMPAWLGVGLGIWPLAAPLPVRMATVLGPPIPLTDPATGGPVDPEDRPALQRLHRKVARTVQTMLNDANGVARAA